MIDLGTHDGVNVQRSGAVLTVTLAQPENRNAQTPATWRRFAEIESLVDDETRVVVLRAEGKSFSAGLDRRMMTVDGVPGEPSILSLAGLSASDVDGFIRQAQAGFTWWGRTHAITIAAVHGHAIGAGFQLALSCDLLVAAQDAQFAMRETSLGLVPDLGGTYPLVRRLGYARALELCASGRFISAGEAVSLGLALAEHPTDEFDDAVASLAESLQHAPAGAVRELKPLLRHAIDASHEQQLAAERTSQIARIEDLRRLMGV